MQQAWQSAIAVVERLGENGFEAVIVGGAVRDYIMNRPFHDVDVATAALPEQVKSIFTKTFDVGIEHGTILVVDMGEPIEVTTYRTETGYSDFRRPDSVQFVRELREDLLRRDFTMNAIAMRADGEIVDYFGGQQAIQNKIIAAVGNAEERFTEDALRMLRAARFRAQLGFSVEEATFEALKNKAALIVHIAIERVAQELSKLFLGNYASKGIATITDSGLAQYLVGEFDEANWEGMTFEHEEQAWAYFYTLNATQHPTLLSTYKCSNKRKLYANQIVQLVNEDEWTVETYFNYELEQLLFAAKVRKQLRRSFVEADEIKRQKQSLSIQTIQELAVTGKEIIAWSKEKKGAWIKERLTYLKRAVLNGEVENNAAQIKEWYDAKFNKE